MVCCGEVWRTCGVLWRVLWLTLLLVDVCGVLWRVVACCGALVVQLWRVVACCGVLVSVNRRNLGQEYDPNV